jgi:glucose-6-phosphate 1-dehydrogenase
LAARVKQEDKKCVGEQNELLLLNEQHGAKTPYERLLGDAMAGSGALFTREDAAEAAWAVVDSVLEADYPLHIYKRGSWAPNPSNALIAADGKWNNPNS